MSAPWSYTELRRNPRLFSRMYDFWCRKPVTGAALALTAHWSYFVLGLHVRSERPLPDLTEQSIPAHDAVHIRWRLRRPTGPP